MLYIPFSYMHKHTERSQVCITSLTLFRGKLNKIECASSFWDAYVVEMLALSYDDLNESTMQDSYHYRIKYIKQRKYNRQLCAGLVLKCFHSHIYYYYGMRKHWNCALHT